jgi:hypothetical protein
MFHRFPSTLLRALRTGAPFKSYAAKTVPTVSIVFGDRRRYLRWLFFGLIVLNYMVTSNHVHLLVRVSLVRPATSFTHSRLPSRLNAQKPHDRDNDHHLDHPAD